MAIYPTHAIIIGRHNFGEADRVMVLLTPERGVIRGVAKGVRRIKSRLAGHLELFSESELMLAEGRNMDTITSARLEHHVAIGDDYDRMRLAYLFAEMVNRLGGDNEHQEGLFELLHDTFAQLEHHTGTVLELWFKLRLLDRLGYRPELNGCVTCGALGSERTYFFNVELGGIVDRGCSSPGNPPVSNNSIKIWRLALGNSFGAVNAIGGIEKLATETLPICNAFYDYTFGKRFRSAEVLT